jgi:hypothetical protein
LFVHVFYGVVGGEVAKEGLEQLLKDLVSLSLSALHFLSSLAISIIAARRENFTNDTMKSSFFLKKGARRFERIAGTWRDVIDDAGVLLDLRWPWQFDSFSWLF